MIMRDVARIGSLIILGIWGGPLCPAPLGALLGAPITLQALARDRVVPQKRDSVNEERGPESLENSIREFLRKKGIPALVEVNVADDLICGAKNLISAYGQGPLTPNTIRSCLERPCRVKAAENMENY